MSETTRRDLLKGMGVATAATLTAGVATQVARADEASDAWWVPESWDLVADVVVMGFGGSGAFSAISAAEEGASVIVLEKAPTADGGNLGCSSGCIHDCPGADVDSWYDCYVHGAFGNPAPEEVIRPILENATACMEWLPEYGIDIDWTECSADGHMYPETYYQGYVAGEGGMTGHWLFEALKKAAEARGVDVRLGLGGKRLIQNPRTKEVLGIVAVDETGAETTVKANKGVIMACGGWENNPQMYSDYTKVGTRPLNLGTPYNTGDGIPMAIEAGANLWHMDEWHPGVMTFVQPALAAGSGFCKSIGNFSQNFCIVDRNGKRFMNEGFIVAHDYGHKAAWDFSSMNAFSKANGAADPEVRKYTTATADFVHLPIFMVFDQTMFEEQNPLVNWDAGQGYACVWNEFHPDDKCILWDTNDDAVAQGWIFKGDTIEELAANIRGEAPCKAPGEAVNGLDPEVLKETIETYNSYVAAGEDPDFFRSPEKMAPIENGPFYAIEVEWLTIFTQGGPQRNENCQTIDVWGQPIPRLYNVGEFGSFNVYLYTIGGILEALTTGRIAGAHAAALEPVAE